MKINIGCGNKKLSEYVNLDIVGRFSDSGKRCDWENDKLDFEDGSVDEIYSEHVLEHFADPKNALNEAWRVLRRGGLLVSRVPYGLWKGAQKPVHKQIITECWFDFLTNEDNFEIYGYRPWDIRDMKKIFSKNDEIVELICFMSPKK